MGFSGKVNYSNFEKKKKGQRKEKDEIYKGRKAESRKWRTKKQDQKDKASL